MKNLITIFLLLVAVGCSKSLTEEEKKIVGSYETKHPQNPTYTATLVLHENKIVETYLRPSPAAVKNAEGTWKILENEVFAKGEYHSLVFKIMTNGDLIVIAKIEDGKRTDFSKKDQTTYKKLKE